MSDAENYNRMVDKAQKLLAQAQDQAGTPEGDSFSARAEEIIQRYSIKKAVEDAQRAAEQGISLSKGDVQREKLFVPAPYAKHKAFLADIVAQFNQCSIVITKNNRGFSQGCFVIVKGFETDIPSVKLLFLSLSLQATNGVAKQEIPTDFFGRRESPAAFRGSWLIGFNEGVRSRMQEQQRRMTAEVSRESGTGAELVLRSKADLVKAAIEEEFPNSRTASLSSSGTGGSSGFRAGRNADLAQKRFSGGSKAALPGTQ